jgi:hypothetical protein
VGVRSPNLEFEFKFGEGRGEQVYESSSLRLKIIRIQLAFKYMHARTIRNPNKETNEHKMQYEPTKKKTYFCITFTKSLRTMPKYIPRDLCHV